MAAADRSPPRHLKALAEAVSGVRSSGFSPALGAPTHLDHLAKAVDGIRKSGLFPVVRGAEARATGFPRIGNSKRPSQNVVDLVQVPTLAFPDATLDSVTLKEGRAKVSGYWLGLTGPMGALPTHLTEFATYERRYSKVQPFGDFLDMLAGRMLQLFYRTWADSQPAAQSDRPDDDRFALYLGMLSGAVEGVAADALFPAKARLHYAGLFASRRSATAIEDGLSHLLRQPVRIREFQPRWRDIEPEDRSRLGRGFATLGQDLVLGRRVRVASDAFRVVIRANSFREYEALLPSGARFAIASEALDGFAPSHLEWDLMIEMEERHAKPTRLDGRARLGWTGWLAPKGSNRVRSDTHLRRKARPPRRMTGGMP